MTPHHGYVRPPSPWEPRSGFTLVEILLVLALLVVLAALVFPALETPLASQRLLRAADQVRTAWIRARLRAMEGGEIQRFTFDTDSRSFRVEPYGSLDAGADPAAGGSAMAAEPCIEGELPEDVTFDVAQATYDPRAMGDAGGDQGPSPPIVFYPDGTTSTAEVWLRNERGQAVPVRVRGLTGVTMVGEIEAFEERGP